MRKNHVWHVGAAASRDRRRRAGLHWVDIFHDRAPVLAPDVRLQRIAKGEDKGKSLPLAPGEHKRIAVKIVDDRGIESLKGLEVE